MLVIKDGNDLERGSVAAYDEKVLDLLRKKFVVRRAGAQVPGLASPGMPELVPAVLGMDVGAERRRLPAVAANGGGDGSALHAAPAGDTSLVPQPSPRAAVTPLVPLAVGGAVLADTGAQDAAAAGALGSQTAAGPVVASRPSTSLRPAFATALLSLRGRAAVVAPRAASLATPAAPVMLAAANGSPAQDALIASPEPDAAGLSASAAARSAFTAALNVEAAAAAADGRPFAPNTQVVPTAAARHGAAYVPPEPAAGRGADASAVAAAVAAAASVLAAAPPAVPAELPAAAAAPPPPAGPYAMPADATLAAGEAATPGIAASSTPVVAPRATFNMQTLRARL